MALHRNFRHPPSSTRFPRDPVRAAMEHIVTAKTLVGSGADTILLEARGGSIRIKRRGAPDVFVPVELAAEVGRFLLAAAAPPARPARASA